MPRGGARPGAGRKPNYTDSGKLLIGLWVEAKWRDQSVAARLTTFKQESRDRNKAAPGTRDPNKTELAEHRKMQRAALQRVALRDFDLEIDEATASGILGKMTEDEKSFKVEDLRYKKHLRVEPVKGGPHGLDAALCAATQEFLCSKSFAKKAYEVWRGMKVAEKINVIWGHRLQNALLGGANGCRLENIAILVQRMRRGL